MTQSMLQLFSKLQNLTYVDNYYYFEENKILKLI